MQDVEEAAASAMEDWQRPSEARPLAVQTEYEVLRLMRECAAGFGFDTFMIARLPAGDRQNFAERLVVSSWPADAVRSYDAANLFGTSVLVESLRNTKLPLFADTAALLGRPGAPFADGTKALETSGTFAALFHTTSAEPYIVTLSGRRRAPEGRETAEIYFLLLQLFERLERTTDVGPTTREKLSAREIECLRWAAAGKSSDEIAIILGISAYTVSSYFKTAARKLNAVNRMQAIAQAMRLKLI